MTLFPREAAPVVGWRAWAFSSPAADRQLLSLNAGVPWPIRRRAAAVCLRHGSDAHIAPVFGCTCGLYATRDRSEQFPGLGRNGVVGEVALWGRIVRHERGYRAEYAYPTRILVPFDFHAQVLEPDGRRLRSIEAAEAAEMIADLYGIETQVADGIRWRAEPRPRQSIAASRGSRAQAGAGCRPLVERERERAEEVCERRLAKIEDRYRQQLERERRRRQDAHRRRWEREIAPLHELDHVGALTEIANSSRPLSYYPGVFAIHDSRVLAALPAADRDRLLAKSRRHAAPEWKKLQRLLRGSRADSSRPCSRPRSPGQVTRPTVRPHSSWSSRSLADPAGSTGAEHVGDEAEHGGVGGVDEVTALDPLDPGRRDRLGHEVRHLGERWWGIPSSDE
jgi:hypothetical protein